MFALIAAAARPALRRGRGASRGGAYFPWIGALHVLLDSLVDQAIDARSGDHSLVSHYAGPGDAAVRLGAIAGASPPVASTGSGSPPRHGLILTAMAAFYLSRPAARAPAALPATELVLGTLGPHATARHGAAEGPALRSIRILESQVVDFPLARRPRQLGMIN